MTSKTIIKTSKHSIINDTNQHKLNNLDSFINEYRLVSEIILNNIWTTEYKWSVNGVEYEFNINKNLLIHPKFIDYNRFKYLFPDTKLSGRVLSSIVTQLTGVIGASVEKQRKRLWILEKIISENKIPSKQLFLKIEQNKPVKPNLENLNPEFSSKCVDFKINNKDKNNYYFDGFLQLKSIGESYGQIKIPIKFHKHSNNLKKKNYIMKSSFLIKKNSIDIRWEKDIQKKIIGNTVGADQGAKDILNLSDKQVTPKTDNNNHSLESIMDKLSRKKKGSRAFGKTQRHRKNFINWSLNQLDLNEIKKINLEKIWNIRYKKSSSRKMSHWTHAEIESKLLSRCSELGIEVQMQDSTYRSQRCSLCGLVLKSNRKGKDYCCKGCGFTEDADYNASCNHEIQLPEIRFDVRKLRLNLKGFYWKPEGLYNLNGEEFRVPLVPSIKE